MKLKRYDSFMIGLALASSISGIFTKNYKVVITQIIILVLYFITMMIINKKDTQQKYGE